MTTEKILIFSGAEALRRLEELADADCTCTFEQMSGVDCTGYDTCPFCHAASVVNRIYQLIRDEYREVARHVQEESNN